MAKSGEVLASSGIDDPAVLAVAEHVLGMIPEGARIGLGSGRASHVFIRLLGAKVKEGFKVEGVPTSLASETLALELGIPLIELTEDVILDLTVDGADEVAPNLDMVKGWGGALVRERIVASASHRQIILVGPEKLVKTIGERGRIPVEIIPLALGYVTRKLKALGLEPTVRLAHGKTFVTDNGNLTLDCAADRPIADGHAARDLEVKILGIAGVVDTGLFLGTANQILMGQVDGEVEELTAKQ